PAGVVTLSGRGVIAGAKVERFFGTIGRANLRSPGFAVLLSGGTVTARSTDKGLDLHLKAHGRGFSVQKLRAADVHLALDLAGVGWAGSGLSLNSGTAKLRAEAVRGKALSLTMGEAHLRFSNWQMERAREGLRASGALNATLGLDQAAGKGWSVKKAAWHASANALAFQTGAAGWRLSGPVVNMLDLSAARYAMGQAPARAEHLTATLQGEIGLSPDGVAGTLAGALKGDLSMAPADARKLVRKIPLFGTDTRTRAAMIGALRGVHVDAPHIYIGKSAGPYVVTLPEPVTLTSRSGARARLAQTGAFLLSRGADGQMKGGFDAALSGGGLPGIDLRVSNYSAQQKKGALSLVSSLVLKARTNLGALRNLSLETSGALTAEGGVYAYHATDCPKVTAGTYLSNNTVLFSHLRTTICARAGEPLLRSDEAGWRFAGQWKNLSARLDAAEAEAHSKTGRIDIRGDGHGMSDGVIESAAARLTDAKAAKRFVPLSATAHLVLAKAKWRGAIGFSIARNGRKVATTTLQHDMRSGKGAADIRADLVLSPDDFQPAELSPLLASLTHARGNAQFRGQLRWTAQRMLSTGHLSVLPTDVTGPLGAVKQVRADIRFTSLAPLVTAPAQTLTAQRIDWLVPLSDLSLKFQYAGDAVQVGSFKAAAASGHIGLSDMRVVLDPSATTSGTLVLDGVNLGALVAASNLADKVSLDATVSGEIPFRVGPDGLRLQNGRFASTGPARLSIRRSVWTGGDATAKDNAIRDFAYQALENLAIDALEARLDSQPHGRLGLVFHIKGRNDPAIGQEARIGVLDLIEGRAFDTALPLPKGTPVDLTLDTSLNFDELLAAYREAFSASLAGAAPQPGADQNEGKTP
ncbi:MAG TPA: YdbH domain-containing protein, partial [Rhizomicrobium sp.]|nr:YdbH domain-containing protein [Rhizomicrobium sp.]